MRLNNLSLSQLNQLATKIRKEIITTIKPYHGHYSSNLGVVEITLALHYLFDLSCDRLIFDIGHQGYAHKYLLNPNALKTIRRKNGVSGLISKADSPYDIETGHAGLSLGLAIANAKLNPDKKTIVLLGDGAFANGINLGALNFIPELQNIIIIINNNHMNISPSNGALYNILNNEKMAQQYFKNYGFNFKYQANGNDLAALINDLKILKTVSKPSVYLINTIKGFGDKEAENDKVGYYHALVAAKNTLHYPQLAATTLQPFLTKYKPYLLQSGMEVGFSMVGYNNLLGAKYFDLAMNEELTMSIAYGLLLAKEKVVIPLYATFLQRTYDQLVNDIMRNQLAPLLLITRTGLIDYDGPTHQGIYVNDLLSSAGIPSYYPLNKEEFKFCFAKYFNENIPMAICYSKEELITFPYQMTVLNKYYFVNKGSKKVFLSYSYLLASNYQALIRLGVSIINTTSGNILDYEMLDYLATQGYTIYIAEDNLFTASLYLKITSYFQSKGYQNKVYGKYLIKKDLPANSLENLLEENSLDQATIIKWLSV